MLFMTIYTYDPTNRDAIVKRRVEKGGMLPKGMESIGEWSSLGGGRVFRLVEATDPSAMMAASFAWSDLGKVEVYPVMETEEVLQTVVGK